MEYPEEWTSTYEIYGQIGEGGGGTVFKAMHKRLRKEVVLKRIDNPHADIRAYRTEVDILKNLHHPYLPQVLDFIESRAGIFTVMDFIPGQSFQQLLDEGHKFTEREVLKYAGQLCEALAYLHAQDPPIIHGDIKPANVMLTPAGNVCLIDFNISGILEGKGACVHGYTPGFSAPEQLASFEAAIRQGKWQTSAGHAAQDASEEEKTLLLTPESDGKTEIIEEAEDRTELLPFAREGAAAANDDAGGVGGANGASSAGASASRQPSAPMPEIIADKRSDIFSLGATLYALLTGKKLDVRASSIEPPDISEGFWIVLSKALERNPARRYSDAGKMLQAILQVHKKDRRYKSLMHRQMAASLMIILLIAAGVLLVAEGRRAMGTEREEAYRALVEQMEDGIGEGMDDDDFDELYAEAVKMFPSYADAYYERAYFLFQTGDYEGVIEYLDDVLDKPLEKDGRLGDLYYLYGDCYFRLEDYGNAELGYRRALRYQKDNPGIYRDYAISLVYLDKVDDASRILDEAMEYGMDQGDIYMVQGEIARKMGHYQEAVDNFENVLDETDDEYLTQRAYVMGSKAYEDMGTKDALLSDTEWLREGLERLDMNDRLLLYERLAQDYISLGEETQEDSYFSSAIEIFEQIEEMGWDTYMTYNNAVVLFQRMGDLGQAEEWAARMLDKYPSNYKTYVRLALLEVEKQNDLDNSDRDYGDFEEYYRQAKEYYGQQVSGNATDAEMQLLENAWEQASEGGWLEGGRG